MKKAEKSSKKNKRYTFFVFCLFCQDIFLEFLVDLKIQKCNLSGNPNALDKGRQKICHETPRADCGLSHYVSIVLSRDSYFQTVPAAAFKRPRPAWKDARFEIRFVCFVWT